MTVGSMLLVLHKRTIVLRTLYSVTSWHSHCHWYSQDSFYHITWLCQLALVWEIGLQLRGPGHMCLCHQAITDR